MIISRTICFCECKSFIQSKEVKITEKDIKENSPNQSMLDKSWFFCDLNFELKPPTFLDLGFSI
ncbi:hypothetical protein MEN41_17715 [Dolichospermum sp. ST_con]|nr:hypothetical protein [Dolichospermum sp. ST_con]MDD1462656.1 hypothetical protein [Dolichospermum sp. ST_sed2]MDD1472787.1 hypothetical protein [Dolichospermum sp. ST_sed4]